MKAVVIESPGSGFKYSEDRTKPKPGDYCLLVQCLAVAINPLDIKQASYGIAIQEWPGVVGIDGAGVVVEIGSKVTNFKVGDRVWGSHRVGQPNYATYQEYFVMDANLSCHWVEGMHLEEACGNGVASATAAMAVFDGLGIPLLEGPESSAGDKEWCLVSGGAGNVGLWAIQYLRLAGYKVIASCSPKSNDLVKKYGACETVNYKDSEEDQLKAIHKATGDHLKYALDFASAASAATCKKALEKSSCSHKILGVLQTEMEPPKASSSPNLTVKPVSLNEWGVNADLDKKAKSMIPMITALWKAQKVKSVPIKIYKGEQGGWKGLANVANEVMKGNGPSGEKAVVNLCS